ncbi:MAG: M48 family metallopeptidase [Patescibacteria group bacterium]
MSLYSISDSNRTKTWIILGVFLLLNIAVGYVLAFIYNDSAILYGAVIVSLILNFASYWYSDKVVLSLAGARPALRAEFFDLYNAVENLSITAGLPMPKVYVVDDPAPNAFATGRNKEHSVICVTTGLLKIMDKNELQGVIAHELSHIGNYDILLSTILVVLAGFISILSNWFLHGGMRGLNGDDSRAGNVLAILGIILVLLSPLFATLLRLAVSRRREALADATGALLTRYPEGLASALEKISKYEKPMIHANDATAHLYISNPFGAEGLKGMHKLFLTHPPIEERIASLRASL